MLSIPIIQIDSKKAHKLDISIALRKIYYQSNGYQRTVKKLYDASLKAKYDFSINEVSNCLKNRLYIRFINSVQDLFLEPYLIVYRFLMNAIKLIFFICPTTKLII